MATPERPNSADISPQIDLKDALANVDRQLELADENENTIERSYKRDQLLELKDELQAELDAATPPSENS